ncbi:MAG: IS110 family transposase, partial [Azospirillum sp.]|nr:IS110 family transposase [Azospirillum sp.]
MEHHAGLDVSLDETSICIVDPECRIIRETKAATDAGAIVAALNAPGIKCR